ncbi:MULTISPECIES: TFIIB-type zinc ribbon-containing protein [unclassified Sphingomonas]|uniref:TFIIB-type zinc ribbon-containing protein n=1 Tax=unclassified Sphingomonas TaxID=196159 RepID=UPI0022B58FC1|nr:zf-TFIIB domain-containing protein [Sphingomonas sp. NIBR02145]WHU04092.1 zf-TFIIB domain-containing protein [Sphingomonas sp. NIBR02145]
MASFTCPVDGTVLVPVERSGIEIDHCPSCRGVWLDRGELDKIIERSAVPAAPVQAQAPQPQYREERPRYDDRAGYGHGGGKYPPKRRKSFLEELFD